MRRRQSKKLASLLTLGASTSAHLITSPASLPHITPTAYPQIGIGHDDLHGRLPGHQLFKRAKQECDGSSFYCDIGTCYEDTLAPYSGLLGCCNAASCAPRTTCIPYTSTLTLPCDVNTGGCLYCSDSKSPACLTITNAIANQWVQYCAEYPSTETVGYTVTGSYAISTWDGTKSAATLYTATQGSFSPVPGMQVVPSSAVSTTQAGSMATNAQASSIAISLTAESTLSGSGPASSASAVDLNSSVVPAPAPQDHAKSGVSGGLIAGIAIGAFAACAMLAAALWALRRYWSGCFGRSQRGINGQVSNEKPPSKDSSPPSTGKGHGIAGSEDTTPRLASTYHSPDHVPRHAELEGRSGSVSAPWPIDTVAVRGLGIAGINPRRYAPTNPDPLSTVDEELSPTEMMPPARPGTSEMPGDRPLPVSPAVSSVPSPNTADLSSSPGGIGAVSPMMPSYKYSSVQYTPSAYAYEPPSSVERTVATGVPPSLPQDYSLVSLGSTSNIYRGLSQHGAAPWAYLSPEEAVRGGWRNSEGE